MFYLSLQKKKKDYMLQLDTWAAVKYMSKKNIGKIPALIKPSSSHFISTATVFLKYQSTPKNVLLQWKMEGINNH